MGIASGPRCNGGAGRRLSGCWVAAAACVVAVACSGPSRGAECSAGDTEVCESPCGAGLRRCGEDGQWEACSPWGGVECLPGESGTCVATEGEPPSLWTCGEDCTMGSCEPGCEPGDRTGCEAECGEGTRRCGETGLWGPCVEEVAPACRPGEVEACDEGGVSRCTGSCTFGPCDEAEPCEPGEEASCRGCGVSRCLPDGRWGPCLAECFPGELRSCASGEGSYCGPSAERCTDLCTWGECVEVLGTNPPDQPNTW